MEEVAMTEQLSTRTSYIIPEDNPAESRVTAYGPQIWAFMGSYLATRADPKAAHLTDRELNQLAADSYDIPVAAVEEAVAYYEVARNKRFIDVWLEVNGA